MPTFTIEVSDQAIAVALGGFIRTQTLMQNGAVCTPSDCYASPGGGGSTAALVIALNASNAIVITSADGTFPTNNPPPGFTPTDNLRAILALKTELFAGESVLLENIGVASVGVAGPRVDTMATTWTLPLPAGRSFFFLITDLYRWTVSATIYSVFVPYVPNTAYPNPVSCPGYTPEQRPALIIQGNYVIVIYWWRLPDVTACGDRQASHLVYAPAQPDPPPDAVGDFERLDPDDPDAAPAPIITSIEPSHGQAGTAFVIIGAGFGDGATVEIDGIAALAIEVRSQYEIHGQAPAHALGLASVVVINPDGIASAP